MHPIGRFLNTSDGAQTESRVGLDSGALRDLWVVISPNLGRLQALVSQGDVKFGRAILAAEGQPPAQRAQQLNTIFQLRDVFINDVAQRFVTQPWASTFLIEVSPLVMWLWIGAIIAALGGLIALWPVPRRSRGGTGSMRRLGRRRCRPRPPRRPPPSPSASASWSDRGLPARAHRARRRGLAHHRSAARRAPPRRRAASAAAAVAELEAARDAKYREIRDAELDVRTGKLSDDDYAALDGSLRAEAVDILHQLDDARSREHERIPSGS